MKKLSGSDIHALTPLPGMYRQKMMDKTHRHLKANPLLRFIPSHLSYPKSGGIVMHHLMRLYPTKGIPYPALVEDFRVLKKIVLGLLSALTGKGSGGAILGFAFTRWSKKVAVLERLLFRINEASEILVSHHYLQKRFYCTQLKELRTLVYLFLKNIGMPKNICSGISDLVMNFLYSDDVYYYFWVDIMTETSKEKLLDNPRKEVLRLWGIYLDRELNAINKKGVRSKLGPLVKALSLVLLHPKIKRAFKDAVKLADTEKMKADEGDRYNCLWVTNYNFMGQPFQIREIVYKELHRQAGHDQLPPMIEVTVS